MSEIQYLEINDVTRIIKVPTNLLLGVMEDKDVERVYFKCKKIVGDNVDLSKHQLYVKYVNALDNSGKNFDVKTPGIYHCEDVVDHGDYITFSWLLSGNVFKKGGFVAFSVLASDGETTRWNTFPAIGTVLITIPGGLQEVEERYPDIITQLLNRMDEVEAMATPEAMQGYVNTYLAAHPAEIDPELLDPKKCAPADVVGQLKEEKISKPRKEDNNKLARAKNGEVEWVDVGQPTDEQTAGAVTKWLNEHPEATTTVQDGSLTEPKINATFLPYIRNNYVTPEMFNAKADGVTDDTEAIQKALDSGKQVLFASAYLSKKLTIPSGCRIYGTNGSKIIFDDTVGFILSGTSIIIDGLSITCNLSRTEQTVAITDNGNRVARSSFKNLKILSWYAGLDLSKGYNDNVIIDNIAFNMVNCCINLKHGDCSIIRNVTAEPFIDYLVFLNQCNAITINDVLATGVRGTYQNNNSVVFIFVGTPNADKRLGVNIFVSSVFCERINTICKSTASFLQINNVYCNENYPLTNAFHFQKSNGATQNTCIILQNINCSNYTGVGVFSSVSAVSEKIGNISFDGKGNMPVIEILNSDDLSYSEEANLNTPVSKSILRQKISKKKNIYFDFEGELSTPPDREDFLIGDIKLRSLFTDNVHKFQNLIGEVYTYKSSSENQWAPIQVGLPTFNRYMLRDTLKGSFPGQLVFNETSNCLAFWNGSTWQNISSETVS